LEKEAVKTFFAPPERLDSQGLKQEIDIIRHDPAVEGVLRLSGGLLLVIDSHRQIVAVNHNLLRDFGVEDVNEVLGLRPGEALYCTHSHDEPAGCGTTRYCSTCGAAIAIVASLSGNVPVSRKCSLTVRRNGRSEELCFLVKTTPININSERFLLLFMQDITAAERMAALERSFFHDINNTIMSLNGALDLLALSQDDIDAHLLDMAQRSMARLVNEVNVQRGLVREGRSAYQLSWQKVRAGAILLEFEQVILSHPAARGRSFEVRGRDNETIFTTDVSLLTRIICNMVINGFEASEEGDTVILAAEGSGDQLVFSAYSRPPIPADVQLRIFQRHFSTKGGAGRGVGTYSMKLFGEELLGGRVSFSSTPEVGTVFTFQVVP